MSFLGHESNANFGRVPERNGAAEWFMCPLKEHLLWIDDCRVLNEFNTPLGQWKSRRDHEQPVAAGG
jgi:hypothetical protein